MKRTGYIQGIKTLIIMILQLITDVGSIKNGRIRLRPYNMHPSKLCTKY